MIGTILRGAGRWLRYISVAVGALVLSGGIVVLATNYSLTQGSGTTFGSIVVGGVNYAQHFLCDLTTPSQCAAVDSSGNLSVKSTTLATVAAQTGTSATTAHGCSTGGYGELGCLGQIDDDIKSPIPAATAPYGIIGGVINGADTYNTIAASQTTQALTGGSGGATGDYLSHCVILPTTTAAGTVIIYDNSTAIFTFTTGTLSNLVPFTIPVGAVSVSGAWKVTTGANETATCVGKFH